MSHVDEGSLHAYLDGALDEYPAAEAQKVREHLEVCAECRAQLETERAIRDVAGSILGLAAPEVEVPSFEELRAYVRANAAGRSPVSVRIYRLGWAASLVLALGSGWMLRGGQIPVDQERGEASPASLEADLRDVAELERPVEEATAQAAPPALGRLAREAAAVRTAPSSARQVLVSDAEKLAEDQARVAAAPRPFVVGGSVVAVDVSSPPNRVADLDVSASAPAATSRLDEVFATNAGRRRAEAETVQAGPAPAPDLVTDAPVATRGQALDAAAAGTDAEPERRSAPAEIVTSANATGPATGLATPGRSVEFGDARDQVAADEDSYSLVVPNLEVLEVRFRGPGVSPEGQVVLQRLESGDTLKVIHLPPEIDPSSLEERAPRDRELVVQRAAGWIVMRAPLSEEFLLELLERLLAER